VSTAAELAVANRILSNEGVMDAFGHASLRLPDRPERFLLSVALPPIVVHEADIVEYGVDGGAPRTDRPLYSESVIHAEIYRARPDVHAICHHHAPAVMPFCISGAPLRAVTQPGASIGHRVPFWDSQDDFGDTNLLLTTSEHGRSLARALGGDWVVLMRRHGATVVGRSLKEMVFRTMASTANAEAQLQAMRLGSAEGLTPGEIDLAGDLRASPIERNWTYAAARLARAEGRDPISRAGNGR
jgi:ribulose-5-phosphate 4-epimerase/fuculose-1-phosphate aldolase